MSSIHKIQRGFLRVGRWASETFLRPDCVTLYHRGPDGIVARATIRTRSGARRSIDA
jgi:hypothetical protein